MPHETAFFEALVSSLAYQDLKEVPLPEGSGRLLTVRIRALQEANRRLTMENGLLIEENHKLRKVKR